MLMKEQWEVQDHIIPLFEGIGQLWLFSSPKTVQAPAHAHFIVVYMAAKAVVSVLIARAGPDILGARDEM